MPTIQEIEQHSYGHIVNYESKIIDTEEGIKTHKMIAGNLPIGYRAPQDIITKFEILFLER
jgi:hypothetical protein